MRQIPWFAALTAAILILPALLCQTVKPIIPLALWEEWSEEVYTTLLRWQTPLTQKPSPVVILEADAKTIDTFGWPIDRTYYVQTLAKLKQSGQPWVLSLLQFQALAKAKMASDSHAQRSASDKALADAIKSYGRYIGTGLEIRQGSELDSDEEEKLMPRITLSRTGTAPSELPRLPLSLAEDQSFVASQKAFGFGAHFGLEAVIQCMQMYLTDANQAGTFLIPSALVWTAAYANQTGIATATGAKWPRTGEPTPFAPHRNLRVSYKECLTSPAVLTLKYLSDRGVKRVSLADFLAEGRRESLQGKVVLLAKPDSRRFRGPGVAEGKDDGVVDEHLLVARFLDGLLSGNVIRRDSLKQNHTLAALPLLLAAALGVLAIFLRTAAVAAAGTGLLGALLVGSLFKLAGGIYVIPIQGMAALAGAVVGLAALATFLAYYGARRQVRFGGKLREALAQCNTLAQIEDLCRGLCLQEFGPCQVEFGGFDRALYEASGEAVLALLDRTATQPTSPVNAVAPAAAKPQTQSLFHPRALSVSLNVTAKNSQLGFIKLALTYKKYEAGFIASLIDLLRTEVAQHWQRIHILAEQKLLDYRYLREQTRGEILTRFLTKALVAKFADGKTMEENLRSVLTPRRTRAALMQADIRGYSRISATMAPTEMVKLLQSYFRGVVDQAQTIAQVKLIGDCVFLFIEDETAPEGISPADLALELAAFLVKTTEEQNAARAATGGEALNFGIAIHYGEVVVGNLSSDSCIDYTVIGPNVNLVARLEELTKHQKLAQALGANGTVISLEAHSALKRYQTAGFERLKLTDYNVGVRSFTNVQEVYGLPAAQAARLAENGSAPLAKAV